MNISDITSRAIDSGFERVDVFYNGAAFRKNKLTVLITRDKENDNLDWLHVSLALPDRNPVYEEIKLVKNIFIGNEKAIMVFPKDEEFVNIHKYCFHLFCCLSKDVLPDFRRGSLL